MPFTFDSSIGFLINKAALRLKAELARAFNAAGYNATPEHWAVLNCLSELDGQTQTQLAGRVAKDKTNMTRILGVMTRNGLVERRPHESDGRSYRVFLTEPGKELVGSLVPIAETVLKRATRGLGPDDLASIRKLMSQVSENLE